MSFHSEQILLLQIPQVNHQDVGGATATMVAILRLGAGAEIQPSGGRQIRGAEMVMLLGYFGADFSICDQDGISPMYLAVYRNDMFIVRFYVCSNAKLEQIFSNFI